MVIRELYVKNFGKLSEKHFYFRDGVQVISGENEFGKTTLHAFVKAMLFGLERGRGRAAAKDDFTKYEPRSGGRYAGVMRFDCGGRHFRLERTFGTGVKNSKSAALICEDDGEELSVEHGDLEMLLGGLTAELFDSTVSVGQLKSRPGEALSDALENYAANYYETGGTELDLSGAVQILREKRKKTDRFIREEADKEERKIQKMLQECEYLEQDMDAALKELKEEESTAMVAAGEGMPLSASAEEKMAQFQQMMNLIIGRALEVNNEKLSQDISRMVNDKVLKEIDYLMRVADERDEERFRQLDETIRLYQKENKGRAEAAAAKAPFLPSIFRKRKFGRNGNKL